MESLKTKSITKVGAGDGFSVFASDNGIVMTSGDGTLGCLGILLKYIVVSRVKKNRIFFQNSHSFITKKLNYGAPLWAANLFMHLFLVFKDLFVTCQFRPLRDRVVYP